MNPKNEYTAEQAAAKLVANSNNSTVNDQLEAERDSESRWAKEYLERAEKAEAEKNRLCERVRNQAERIRYLEGATNHATGTPLSAAEKRVKELESQLSLAQHHASGRWGEYDRALVRVRALAAENAKLQEDKARLDWVQADTVRVGDVLGYFMSCEGVDIRKAIDAARAQKGGAS